MKMITIISQMLRAKDGWHLSFAWYPIPVGMPKRAWLRLIEWKSSGTGAMDGPDWITVRISGHTLTSDTNLKERVVPGPAAGPLYMNMLLKVLMYTALWYCVIFFWEIPIQTVLIYTLVVLTIIFVLYFFKNMFIHNF